MKVALSIPDELFESAETLGRRLGVSRSRLYATALADYVASHEDRERGEVCRDFLLERAGRVRGHLDLLATFLIRPTFRMSRARQCSIASRLHSELAIRDAASNPTTVESLGALAER